MDYTLTVYFLQKWRDPRLVLDPNSEFGPPGWLDNCSLALSSVVEADIWVPDVFFVNEKSSFRHTVTMMNTMVRLYPDGNVFYSIRITMKLVCPMQMHKYPLDEQNCSLIMESYSHSEDEMTLYLMSNEALGVNNIDNSINGLKDLTLQQFEVCYQRFLNAHLMIKDTAGVCYANPPYTKRLHKSSHNPQGFGKTLTTFPVPSLLFPISVLASATHHLLSASVLRAVHPYHHSELGLFLDQLRSHSRPCFFRHNYSYDDDNDLHACLGGNAQDSRPESARCLYARVFR